MAAQLQSRSELVEAPFVAAIRTDPRFDPEAVTHNDDGELAQVPGVAVTATQGEERLDVTGDAWEFSVTITARRPSSDNGQLDRDAAAIERITTTNMVGSPGINLMIAEEAIGGERGTEGKARTWTIEIPLLVRFS